MKRIFQKRKFCCPEIKPKPLQLFGGVNGVPRTKQGRVMHLDLREGELANRIVTVGDAARLQVLSSMLDSKPKFSHTSPRGFSALTGEFKGYPVSIVCIGMGFPNMDFFVREAREVVEGKMAVIRFGSCGGIDEKIKVGSVVVSTKGSIFIQRNPDAFRRNVVESHEEGYKISFPVYPNLELSKILHRELKGRIPDYVVEGLNVSADSFYSSEGRVSKFFQDSNGHILEKIKQAYPEALSMEMENFHLFDLAENSGGSINAAAATVVYANRFTEEFINAELQQFITAAVSSGILEAIILQEI